MCSYFGPGNFSVWSVAILLQVSLIRFPTTIPMHHHFVVLEVVLLELPTSLVDPNIPRCLGLLTGVSLKGGLHLRSYVLLYLIWTRWF